MDVLSLLLHDERFSGWTTKDKLTRYHFSTQFLKFIKEFGWNPSLYTFHQSLKRKEVYECSFGQVKIFPVAFRFPPFLNFGNDHNPKMIFREMLRENLDIVHFHQYYLFSFPYTVRFVKRKLNLPLTTQLHGYYTNPLKGAIYFPCLTSLKKVDRIFYSYSPEKRVYERLGVSEKAVKIPTPGLNPSIFKPAKRDRELDLLYVGRIPLPTSKIGEKKPHLLLFILRELIKRKKDVKLRVVGDGPGLPYMRRLSSKLGLEEKVVFEGYIPHSKLPEHYQSSALTLVPLELCDIDGWFDGSIQESLACGTPVAAFKNNPRIPLKGKFGFLLSKKPEKAADELFFLLERREMLHEVTEQGTKVVRNHCSFSSLSKKLRTLWEEVARK